MQKKAPLVIFKQKLSKMFGSPTGIIEKRKKQSECNMYSQGPDKIIKVLTL